MSYNLSSQLFVWWALMLLGLVFVGILLLVSLHQSYYYLELSPSRIGWQFWIIGLFLGYWSFGLVFMSSSSRLGNIGFYYSHSYSLSSQFSSFYSSFSLSLSYFLGRSAGSGWLTNSQNSSSSSSSSRLSADWMLLFRFIYFSQWISERLPANIFMLFVEMSCNLREFRRCTSSTFSWIFWRYCFRVYGVFLGEQVAGWLSGGYECYQDYQREGWFSDMSSTSYSSPSRILRPNSYQYCLLISLKSISPRLPSPTDSSSQNNFQSKPTPMII